MGAGLEAGFLAREIRERHKNSFCHRRTQTDTDIYFFPAEGAKQAKSLFDMNISVVGIFMIGQPIMKTTKP